MSRSSLPFSAGEAERLRDFLLLDFSLDWPRDPRSDFTLEVLLDRDLRVSERERDLRLADLLRDLWVRERECDLRERDLLEGDLERDLRPERERDLWLDREWERCRREWDLDLLREWLLLRLLLRERRRLRDLE